MLNRLIDTIAGLIPLDPADRERLAAALAKERDGAGLTEAAVKTRLVPESVMLKALGDIFEMEVAEGASLSVSAGVEDWAGKVSRQFLKRCCILPVLTEDSCFIAVNDPSDPGPADDLAARLKMADYIRVLALRQDILSAVNSVYERSQDQTRQLVEDMEGEEAFLNLDDISETADLLDDTSDAPVIRLVNHMISRAVKAGASDIHIEPFQDSLQVRYRIDGILYEMLTPPKGVQSALVSRVKVMAGMNIAEKRVPQDGRAQVRIGDQEIDLRISTVPTGFGERLVMRLLNKSGYFLALSEFGMRPETLDRLYTIIRQTHGIVLVTGPTGSGKTTTLYAGLSEINAPEKSIITIEDPVEYNLEGIGQIQVNQKTGVTFARGLRSIVRQDPDVILIGEIRDIETAEIAIQS
ncbi:MAG: GspE/PulE family protein, partial [Desulfobacterales bacterium]|nr:GspE/PulE family protein [Desulfobacterales bacterium]